MARQTNILTPLAIKTLGVGLHRDGAGLYLQVAQRKHETKDGQPSVSLSRSWVYRYSDSYTTPEGQLKQRQHKLGLGSIDRIPLKRARLLTEELNYRRQRGEDLIGQRQKQRQQAKLDQLKGKTLEQVALERIAAKAKEWKAGGKSEAQWRQSLKDHVYEHIGFMAVNDIDTTDICRVLEPIWATKTETARRVQQRLADIFDYAIALGYRQGKNPAAWKNNLENVLADPKKFQRVKNFESIEHSQIHDFVTGLQAQGDDMAAKCLLLVTWTACRSTEARDARWGEFDLDNATWTVPASRMKGGKEHIKPLSRETVAMLRQVPKSPKTDLVFPSTTDSMISDVRLKDMIKRLGFEKATIHGLRSSFKSWSLDFEKNQEATEAQLAHTNGSKVESAYIRTDLLELRRALVQQWCDYTTTKRDSKASVTDIHTGKQIASGA